MNDLNYEIELIEIKKNYLREFFLGLVVIVSFVFYDYLGAWLAGIILLILVLTIVSNLIPKKSQAVLNVLDDVLLEENSKKYSVKHNDGWYIEFEQLPIEDYKNFYRIWGNIDKTGDDLYSLNNLKKIFTAKQNVFTSFIAEKNDTFILQSLSFKNYKLDSSLIILKDGHLISSQNIGPYVLKEIDVDVFEGKNGTSKIQINLTDKK